MLQGAKGCYRLQRISTRGIPATHARVSPETGAYAFHELTASSTLEFFVLSEDRRERGWTSRWLAGANLRSQPRFSGGGGGGGGTSHENTMCLRSRLNLNSEKTPCGKAHGVYARCCPGHSDDPSRSNRAHVGRFDKSNEIDAFMEEPAEGKTNLVNIRDA